MTAMEKALNRYLDMIKADYTNQNWACSEDIKNDMIARFVKGVSYQDGKKYIKVVTGGSVHSFIVKEDDAKFKKGDILKAAGWNAPAKNAARGNIFNENIKTSWTGAFYLK
jgi:hypothetical protein